MHNSPDGLVLRVAHTADLAPEDLVRARELLDRVFEGDMGDADWDHALGGVHALVWAGDALVGHGSVVQRRLLHAGKALRTGYVEGVAVDAAWRRRSVGGLIMSALERVIDRAYEVGALGASEDGDPFYAQRRWDRWRGPTFALGPDGIVRTAEEDGGIFVWPGTAALDPDGALTCDWRDGDVW